MTESAAPKGPGQGGVGPRSSSGSVVAVPSPRWADASPYVVGPGLLATGRAGGPLTGRTFVAKDLFDVRGLRTGAGHPQWLDEAVPATAHALAVERLLDAGASLVGTTLTDELAWSISGTNAHYGAPANPAAPGRAPGGSSAGSAVAVARGDCDLGLGSDTGGSVRVPASYCGLWGLRPTHGRLPVAGMVALAPSFDTVGLLARSPEVLAAGFAALDGGHGGRDDGGHGGGEGAGGAPVAPARVLLAVDLLDRCDPGVAPSIRAAAAAVAARAGLAVEEVVLGAGGAGLDAWIEAFRVLQSAEVWAVHGEWLASRRPALGPGVAARAEYAASLTAADVAAAAPVRDEVRARLAAVLGDDAVVALPATPGPAHPLAMAPDAKQALRLRTFACCVPAGMAGAPSVALPLATSPEGLPVGLALVGRPGDDERLLAVAAAAATPPAGAGGIA